MDLSQHWHSVLDGFLRIRRRIKRIERTETASVKQWLGHTDNLIHLSIVFFIPLLIGLLTLLSNRWEIISFLLFPPLASGTYTLFSDPEGQYANPVRFILSLSVGAGCGFVAAASVEWLSLESNVVGINPLGAVSAVFLTGLITWIAKIEAPSAFATALLTLATERVEPLTYVASIIICSLIIGGAFTIWRHEFYEERAQYLYKTVKADDHILVPLQELADERLAFFAGRIAGAHEAGKLVLLRPASSSSDLIDTTASGTDNQSSDIVFDSETSIDDIADPATKTVVKETERLANQIRTKAGVPCDVVVARGEMLSTTVQTAQQTNCDLVTGSYAEEEADDYSSLTRGIFNAPIDSIVFRGGEKNERTQWRRILVMVARRGENAHGMIDFATRLAGSHGTVSVTSCILDEVERRPTERQLEQLVETASGNIETRVARSDPADFVHANAETYDLVFVGSSRDRSGASRFISPPTFHQIKQVDTDLAIFNASM
jgi:nucleotide-binding universal stress UspA family protein